MNENLVLLIFFSQVLLAIFLLSLKKGNLLSFRLLASFLLLGALDLSNFIAGNFYAAHQVIDMTRANTALFYGPLLYLFVRSVLYSDLRIRLKDTLHLLPFVVMTLVFMPNFYLASDEQQMLFRQHILEQPETMLISLVNHVQIAIYLALAIRDYIRQQNVIRDNYSDHARLKNQWLKFFLLLFSIHYVIVLVRNITKFVDPQLSIDVLTPVMLTTTLMFYTWLLFQALTKPELFNGIDSQLDAEKTGKTRSLEMESGQKNKLVEKLTSHLKSNKPWLQPSLTLEELAGQLSIEKDTLSLLINHHMNSHFFDLMNEYRINHAAQLLTDKSQADKTILDIMLDVGFNSKSSFNTAFKQRMQQTPSAYRKSQQNA